MFYIFPASFWQISGTGNANCISGLSTEYPEPGTPFDRKFPAGNISFTTVKSQTTSKSDLGNTSDLPEIMIDVFKGEHHYFCQRFLHL